MKPISGDASKRRWQQILQIDTISTQASSLPTSRKSSDDDPFDCKPFRYRNTTDRIISHMETAVKEWKNLDERRLERQWKRKKSGRVRFEATPAESAGSAVAAAAGATSASTDIVNAAAPATTHEATAPTAQRTSQQDQAEREYMQRKRAELKRKTRSVPYGWGEYSSEERLKLPPGFDYQTKRARPPSDQEVEELLDGQCIDRVVDLNDPTVQLSYHQELWKIFQRMPTMEEIEATHKDQSLISNTEAMIKEMNEGLDGNTRLDGHAVSRLRSSDRHGLPPPPSSSPRISTVKFEFLRRQPKRGINISHNRAVVEFRCDQTLQDVHDCVVDMTDDDLWLHDQHMKSSGSTPMQSDGFFFIEDTFFVTDGVDYSKPIHRWMDGLSPTPMCARRLYLGISMDKTLTTKPMKHARLGDLKLRFGIRYHHCHHGDLETTMFVIDMRYSHKAEIAYPIIYDAFRPLATTMVCGACKLLPPTHITSSHCAITHGQKQLCQRCCVQLKLDPNDKTTVQRISSWRNQADLSSYSSREKHF